MSVWALFTIRRRPSTPDGAQSSLCLASQHLPRGCPTLPIVLCGDLSATLGTARPFLSTIASTQIYSTCQNHAKVNFHKSTQKRSDDWSQQRRGEEIREARAARHVCSWGTDTSASPLICTLSITPNVSARCVMESVARCSKVVVLDTLSHSFIAYSQTVVL